MGTDWLQLFDKRLSDKILAMNRQRLVRFIEENIDVLKEKGVSRPSNGQLSQPATFQ